MKKQIVFTSMVLAFVFQVKAQSILGIDVSHYDGTVNWTQVKNAGYVFAWAKATEGTNITDSQYLTNAVNAVNAGLYMGAYHFAKPDINSTTSGAIAEANYFLSVAQPYIISCELPPVLDLEVSTSLTNAQLSAWVQTWMNTVQNATGIVPILYTSGSIATKMSVAVALYCKLWIADPDGSATATPPTLGNWSPNWSFKQYSWTGTVPGISGNVDLDSYHGTLSELQSLMGCNSTPPPTCTHYYTTLPYATSFENTWVIDSCATNGTQRIPDKYWKSTIGGTSPSGDDYWHRDDYTGTDWTVATNGQYAPAASDGNYSARFHNEPAHAGSTGALDLYINLSSSGTKTIKFDYIHDEVSAAPFTFNVLLSIDSGNTFTDTLLLITTAQLSQWTAQTLTTTATSATSVLRFIATDKGTHDVGIDNLNISIINTAGIKELINTKDLKIFPNPSDGLVLNGKFSNTENNSMNTKIYDLTGRELFSEQTKISGGAFSLLFEHPLETGMYIFVGSVNEKQYVQHVVVK